MKDNTITEWREVKLGDVCSSISDTYRRNDKEVVLINTSDVLDGKILNHSPVKNEKLKGQFKKTFQNNDILYSEIRPANKRFAFVDILNTNNYIASTKLMVLRPNTNKILPKFLYCILKSDDIINELQHLAETRSGTFPQITFSAELAPMEILLPPLDIQQKIAEMLGVLDDKIELNNKINNNLEQQAQALFKSWFVDFEPFGGTMPKDWQIKTLKEVVTFSQGVQVPVQKQITELIDGYEQFIRIVDLTQNNSDIRFIENVDKGKITYDDIFMIRYGTPGILGRNYKGIIANNLFKIEPINNIISKNYIYNFLNSDFIQNYIKQNAVSSTMPAINFSTLYGQELIIPDAKTLTDYTKIDESMRKQMLQIKFENERLTQLRDVLLPKLMSGEIDVSKVNISADKLSFTEE